MKQLIALAFVVLFGSVALLAKEAVFTACTSDKQAVELTLDIANDAPASIAEHVSDAFKNAARELTVGELQSREGFLKFVSYLSGDDLEEIAVSGPPAVVDGPCK